MFIKERPQIHHTVLVCNEDFISPSARRWILGHGSFLFGFVFFSNSPGGTHLIYLIFFSLHRPLAHSHFSSNALCSDQILIPVSQGDWYGMFLTALRSLSVARNDIPYSCLPIVSVHSGHRAVSDVSKYHAIPCSEPHIKPFRNMS